MKRLTEVEFENLCEQAGGRDLFSSTKFNDCFNLPSEFQKELAKKNRKNITYAGIFYSFWGIFSGVAALALFSAPFQMWNYMPSKGMHSFTDALYFLALFGILYGVGFGFFYIFWNRFINSKNRYIRKCLKNGNFTVQECTPIGYAEYGRIATDSIGGSFYLYVVLKGDNGKIYVFGEYYIAFVKNVTKAKSAFLIKVDNIGKKKEEEVFVICY